MNKKVWLVDQDSSIQCQQLTSEYLEDALSVMEKSFFPHENVCKALGVSEDQETVAELQEFVRYLAKDGVSIIAVDKQKNKVIGVAFNKLETKETSEGAFSLEKLLTVYKRPRSIAVIKFLLEIENMCNLFEHCQTDCILEIMFVGTLPECRGKGIAKKLCEASLELGKDLLKGINVKIPLDEQTLGLEPVPKVAASIFTSFITQRIGRQLGFQIAAERSYDMFEYEGKTYASVIGKNTPGLTIEYKRLDEE